MFSTQGLSFTFTENGIRAVDHADISFKSGCIYALLGENGAGKSTLARLCTGHLQPDSGTLILNGTPVAFRTPADAIRAGVCLVPQHPELPPDLFLWEYLCMGLHTDPALAVRIIRKSTTAAIVKEQLAGWGLELPLFQKNAQLDTAHIHWAAFAEALLKKPQVLFLDEPSASYSPQETDAFYRILRTSAQKGMCIAVITHRIQEVVDYMDYVYILRNGVPVMETAVDTHLDKTQLIRGLFENIDPPVLPTVRISAPQTVPEERTDTGGSGLVLAHVAAAAVHGADLSDVSLHVPHGSITGIVGIKSQGLELLEDMLAGRIRPQSGSIRFDGCAIDKLSRETIAYIPSKRLERGVAADKTIGENSIIRARKTVYPYGRYSHTQQKQWKLRSEKLFDRAWDAPVLSLSGGMIQRLIFNRELYNPAPQLVICAEPYWGLDRRVQETLRRTLQDLAQNGAAVVILTSDVDAALAVCSRIQVLYRGCLTYSTETAHADRDTLLAAMLQTGSTDAVLYRASLMNDSRPGI